MAWLILILKHKTATKEGRTAKKAKSDKEFSQSGKEAQNRARSPAKGKVTDRDPIRQGFAEKGS